MLKTCYDLKYLLICHQNKIKDLKDKYIMKALKAYMDVHRQWLEEDDEELTDSEV